MHAEVAVWQSARTWRQLFFEQKPGFSLVLLFLNSQLSKNYMWIDNPNAIYDQSIQRLWRKMQNYCNQQKKSLVPSLAANLNKFACKNLSGVWPPWVTEWNPVRPLQKFLPLDSTSWVRNRKISIAPAAQFCISEIAHFLVQKFSWDDSWHRRQIKCRQKFRK